MSSLNNGSHSSRLESRNREAPFLFWKTPSSQRTDHAGLVLPSIRCVNSNPHDLTSTHIMNLQHQPPPAPPPTRFLPCSCTILPVPHSVPEGTSTLTIHGLQTYLDPLNGESTAIKQLTDRLHEGLRHQQQVCENAVTARKFLEEQLRDAREVEERARDDLRRGIDGCIGKMSELRDKIELEKRRREQQSTSGEPPWTSFVEELEKEVASSGPRPEGGQQTGDKRPRTISSLASPTDPSESPQNSPDSDRPILSPLSESGSNSTPQQPPKKRYRNVSYGLSLGRMPAAVATSIIENFKPTNSSTAWPVETLPSCRFDILGSHEIQRRNKAGLRRAYCVWCKFQNNGGRTRTLKVVETTPGEEGDDEVQLKVRRTPQSRYGCTFCKVALCKTCFEPFHRREEASTEEPP